MPVAHAGKKILLALAAVIAPTVVEPSSSSSLLNFAEIAVGITHERFNQAAGGVASRGAPDDPEASEAVSLSQLEEAKAMQDNLAAQREATRCGLILYV